MKKQRQHSSNFTDLVRTIVRKIPKGKTLTYGQVATLAGKPMAARAVGMIMSKNFDPNIPCHRVVRADGTVGDYNRGGAARKMKLLREEGAIK